VSTECRLLPLSSTRTEQAGLRDSSSELTTPFCIYVLLLRVVVVLGVLGVVVALSRYKSKHMFKSPRVLIRGRRTRWLAGRPPSLHEFLLVKLHDRPTERHTTRDRSQAANGATPAADSPNPASVIGCPFLLYSLGSLRPSGGIRNSRTRQVSLNSTLLSCIQSFSRSIRRASERGKGEDHVCRLGVRS
jgi:hypothetical protein